MSSHVHVSSSFVNIFVSTIPNAAQLDWSTLPDVRHFASTDDVYLEELRQACTRRGLRIDYLGVPTNHAQEGADYDENIARLKQWIDIAAKMGVPMVRTFGGWHRPGMPSEEDTIQRIIGSIKVCAAYAAEKKVLIGLHNHNHGQIPSTGEQALAILDGVGSPYFVGLMDTGQWHGSPGIGAGPEGNEEGTERGTVDAKFDYMASIRMCAPRAVQVRAKIYRIRSGVEAWLDYESIMSILKNAGYNGWMSIVYEGQDDLDEPTALPLAVDYLRSLCGKYKL